MGNMTIWENKPIKNALGLNVIALNARKLIDIPTANMINAKAKLINRLSGMILRVISGKINEVINILTTIEKPRYFMLSTKFPLHSHPVMKSIGRKHLDD